MAHRPTKQHILEATITAIEKYGLQNITTRVIAQEAGVNNAALHYYFGTKEHLLTEALTLTLDHMMGDTDEILSRQISIDDRLRALFEYLIEGMLLFPNIIRAHLSGPLMEGEQDSPFIRMVNAWLERTSLELNQVLPPEQKANAPLRLFTVLTTTLFAGILPGLQDSPAHIDFRDATLRARYIDYLVDLILHDSRQPLRHGPNPGLEE